MNPYQTPSSDVSAGGDNSYEFVGFLPRLFASIVDSFLTLLVQIPLIYLVFGGEYFDQEAPLVREMHPIEVVISYVLPAVAVILFWVYKAATPGKMLIGARIVDSRTLARASTGQLVIRYFGYLISSLPLALGFLWVIWDPQRQGWHDKIARTVVIRRPTRYVGPGGFEA